MAYVYVLNKSNCNVRSRLFKFSNVTSNAIKSFAIVAENKQLGRFIYSMYFRDNLVINYAYQLEIIFYPEQERKDTDKVDMYGR